VDLPPIVVMGVSGSGKTTVGTALAERVGGVFLDADDLHPAANVHKMSQGIPLNDADRAPWLDIVGKEIRKRQGEGRTVVMACSALKRKYRERIRAEEPAAFFVLLTGTREELERRMQARHGHFMPASLLDSQLDTLEPLGSNEHGATVNIHGTKQQVVDRVLDAATHSKRPA
jgi:carbohydrate kinase (thermoresistant glucokinase family)